MFLECCVYSYYVVLSTNIILWSLPTCSILYCMNYYAQVLMIVHYYVIVMLYLLILNHKDYQVYQSTLHTPKLLGSTIIIY